MAETTQVELKRIGLTIRRARTALGYSQERFAEKANIHPTYVSRIERGRVNLSWDILSQCARGLRLKPSKLLARSRL